jgi:hypothetical protein
MRPVSGGLHPRWSYARTEISVDALHHSEPGLCAICGKDRLRECGGRLDIDPGVGNIGDIVMRHWEEPWEIEGERASRRIL